MSSIQIQDRLKEWEGLLTWDEATCKRLYNDMLIQCQRGLNMHKKDSSCWRAAESDLMYFDTAVEQLPSGREQGVFYGLDFGGSNCRVVRCHLKGHGQPMEVTQYAEHMREQGKSDLLPCGVRDSKATATLLFDTLANIVKKFMEENGDIRSSSLIPCGFTFSFGISQPSLDRAILLEWSKEYQTGINTNDPVIGQDVCKLMNQAFQRCSVPCRIVGACNDTTGTMIAAAMEKPPTYPPCTVGMILGTGVNGCYHEPDAGDYKYVGNVINTESGNFRGSTPMTIADVEINHYSAIPGQMICEKILSAHYLPEVIRLVLIRIFQGDAPNKMWTAYSLPSDATAKIFAEDSGCTKAAAEVMGHCYDWHPSEDHLLAVKKVVDLAWRRSAALAAVLACGLARKTKRLQPAMGGVTIGIDGSLYTKNEKYQLAFKEYIKVILGEQLSKYIYPVISSDGSGKGAACLAASVV